MERNLILIGMMGCGKTTIGQLLAEKLGRTLMDTDAMIEKEEGCTISELFAAKGEACFRELELSVSQKLALESGLVISCGGGLPLRADCIGLLKQTGTVIWLCRDPGETYDSLDVTGRPLAQQGKRTFVERFEQREPIYRQWADIIIEDFSSPDATLHAVLEGLK